VVGFGPSMGELETAAGVRCGEPLASAEPNEIGAALDRVLWADWDRAELRRRVLDAYPPEHAAGAYADLIHRLAGRNPAVEAASRLVAERP
jgi:hypothetical protein